MSARLIGYYVPADGQHSQLEVREDHEELFFQFTQDGDRINLSYAQAHDLIEALQTLLDD
jgi:hypothetical protein